MFILPVGPADIEPLTVKRVRTIYRRQTDLRHNLSHATGQPGVSTILRVLPVLIYGVAQTAIQERIGTVR
jgi:hypothetical protein